MKKFIALLFLSTIARATVVVDSQTTITALINNPSNNILIGNGINRLLLAECDVITGAPIVNISSITIGVSLSTFTLIQRGSQTDHQQELWYYVNPATGTQNVQVNEGTNRPNCGLVSFFNVNQSSPIDATSGQQTSGTINFTTTVSSDMLVDIFGEGTQGTIPFTPGAGQNQQWSIYSAGGFTGRAGSTQLAGAPGSQTMSWVTTGAVGFQMATSIQPSTGAPDTASFSPPSAGVGSSTFTLTINGDNFQNGAIVTLNGTQRSTTFLSAIQLSIIVSTNDTVALAQLPLFVTNPDGGVSSIVNYTITGDINFVWATDGGYKPTQNDLYGTLNSTTVTNTRMWNGNTVTPFQAINEIHGFALVLENGTSVNAPTVSVNYPVLTGPNGYVISSTPSASVATLWDWRNRPIEVYMARYQHIYGLTRTTWDSYDELAVPKRFQTTCSLQSSGQCVATGGWAQRPDHDKSYPDPLIPIEAVIGGTFTVNAGNSQAIWFDIYTPKTAPPGTYTGTINVYEGTTISTSIPISLLVYPFTMPDDPPAKVITEMETAPIALRHEGVEFPNYGGPYDAYGTTRRHYIQMLKRFGVNVESDGTYCQSAGYNTPCPETQLALSGALFTNATGYANAPGVNTPLRLQWLGPWNGSVWQPNYTSTCQNASKWVNWYNQNAPGTEIYWYIADEPTDLTTTNLYSTWISTCPAPGNQLKTYVTNPISKIVVGAPNITHPADTWSLDVLDENRTRLYTSNPARRITTYGGDRPFNGTMATEDEAVGFRVREWFQYKKHFDHFFLWDATYFQNETGGNVQTDVFNVAHTFGYDGAFNVRYGSTTANYANGDGVIIYPGTDTVYPNSSYGADVPFPSWRLMMMRVGINDFTALTLAAKYDSKTVDALVQQIIPKVSWEYGCFDPNDCTYQYGDVSWSVDPNVWELAREKLYQIITNHR